MVLRSFLVFVLSILALEVNADVCTDTKQEEQCIEEIVNAYLEEETISSSFKQTLLRYSALKGNKPDLGRADYYTDSSSVQKPLALYYIYHLLNERDYEGMVNYLATTRVAQHWNHKLYFEMFICGDGEAYPKQHSNHRRSFQRGASDICTIASSILYQHKQEDVVEDLRKKTFCGNDDFFNAYVSLRARFLAKSKRYDGIHKLVDQCGDDFICTHMASNSATKCLKFSSRNQLSQTEKQNLNNFIVQLGSYVEDLGNISRDLFDNNYLAVFIRSLSKKELINSIISKKINYPYAVNEKYWKEKTPIEKQFLIYFFGNVRTLLPNISDHELSELIKKIDKVHNNSDTNKPLIHFPDLQLFKDGFIEAAITAAKVNRYPEKQHVTKEIRNFNILRNLLMKQDHFPEFMRYTHGEHQKCMTLVKPEIYKCIEDEYLRINDSYSIFNGCDDDSKSNDAKFQCKTGHLYHVNANKWDVVIWKIERGDFESALSLIVDLKKRRDDYLEDVSQQPVSKNLNKELSLDGVHKRLNKKQQEVRQKISNIPDEVFNEKNCLPFLNSNPNVPFEYNENPSDPLSSVSAKIFSNCLANLSLGNFVKFLNEDKRYSSEEAQKPFSGLYTSSLFYSVENDPKVQLSLKYPFLTKFMHKRTREFIRWGYKDVPLPSFNARDDYNVFIQKYAQTKDLVKRKKLLKVFIQGRNEKLIPENEDVYDYCKGPI